MQVHCDEGVATHIGPKPCVSAREGRGEASAGEHTGQPLSREITETRTPTPLIRRKATRRVRHRERLGGPARSETLACVDAPCAGTGRSPAWPAASAAWSASGRRGAEADDARAGEVRPLHSSHEADEQSRDAGGGAGGAKGGGQGKHASAAHAPGSGPGKRVTGAGACTESGTKPEDGTGSPRSSTISTQPCCGRRSSPSGGRGRRVDGLTWRAYEADLDRRIDDLHRRVQRGAYRAQPARRRFIPKPDGRMRPLAIAALEDKSSKGLRWRC